MNKKLLSNERQLLLGGRIHQYFFISALVTIFTLGCMWGAINLLLIGLEEGFHGIDYSWVLAHGHAMVFGFVGLFIMGFSYRALPHFKGTTLWNPWLALSTLPLMIAGILLQAYAHVIAPRQSYLTLGIFSGLIQIVAVAIFVMVIARTCVLLPRDRKTTGSLLQQLSGFLSRQY